MFWGGGRIPLFAQGALLDPTGLPLTVFLRDFTNPTWTGTASKGTSGSINGEDPGNEPAQGTALNGFGTADFDGTNDFLTIGNGTQQLSSLIGATSLSGWVLLNSDSFAATKSIVWFQGGVELRVVGGSGQVGLLLNSTTQGVRAIGTGAYTLVTFRYDGTNSQIGVNEPPGASGGGSSAAYSTAISGMTNTNHIIGSLNGGSQFYDGHIAEFALSDQVFGDQIFLDLKTHINFRYGLSL